MSSQDEAKLYKAELKDGGTLGSLVTSSEQLASSRMRAAVFLAFPVTLDSNFPLLLKTV